MTDTPVSPPAVGQSLRQRRLQKNLTTEQAAQDTRIHIKYIRALEEERWADFPARVYLEGFLKRYGEYLGLEEAPLVTGLRKLFQEAERPGFSSPAPTEHEDASMSPTAGRSVWFLAGGAALVLSLALTYVKLEERRMEATSHAAPEPLSTQTVPAAPPLPVAREAHVSAKAPVWVRVWIDDRVRFEGILSANKPKTWPVEKKLRLMAGNPSLVTVVVDGQPVVSTPGGPAGELNWVLPEESPAPEPVPVSPPPAAPVAPRPVIRRTAPPAASTPTAVKPSTPPAGDPAPMDQQR